MSLHQATIYWTREPHSTDNSTYSRNHAALLNGQQSVKLSASVQSDRGSHFDIDQRSQVVMQKFRYLPARTPERRKIPIY